MLLTLIRHGETEHNKGQLTLGRADVPLNARGLRQARAVAASVARSPTALYASPLARCRDTANVISVATDVSVTVDPGAGGSGYTNPIVTITDVYGTVAKEIIA